MTDVPSRRLAADDDWLLAPVDDGFCILEKLDGEPVDFRFGVANPAFAAHVCVEELIGKTFREVFPELAEEWASVYDGVLQTGQSRRVERALADRGRIFEMVAFPVAGQSQRAVAVRLKDISQRAEEARTLERRLRDGQRLVEISRSLVGMLEFDQVTRLICAAARELIGADGATFVLRDGSEVHYVAEDAIAPLWQGQRFPIEQCISGWAIANASVAVIADIYADMRIPHAAYQPTFVSSLVMMPVGPGSPVASIGAYWAARHEATDYELELLRSLASSADLALVSVRAYDEARRARAEAEQANRVKDELLATVSHELRNPLNVIAGYAELLWHDEGIGQSPQLRGAVAGIRRNVRVQAQLVNDLLDLARLRSGTLTVAREPCDLESLASEAVAAVRDQLEAKAITAHLEGESMPVIVSADPARVQQILWNLMHNAVKFTPRQGRIVVRVVHDGTSGSVWVVDSGKGIEPAFLPRVFEIFQQADTGTTRAFGGLGVGLALVRQLVELQAGTIEAQSEGPGRGASFIVRLPLHSEPGPVRRSLSQSGLLSGARILVVDDTEDAAELLGQLLVSEGAIVATAMSGPAGLRTVEDTEFDLIISDISMPEMDGYQFLGKVRELSRYQHVPAIALTGLAREEDLERARQAGFTSHMAKPVDFANLVALARRTLGA